MNISNSFSQVFNSIQLSHSEHIVLQTLMYPITPLVKVFCQLSSLTIAYSNMGFNSFSLTLLVPISSSCRPPSHHTILCRLNYYSFFTMCILLEICMACLVSLPFLAIHKFNLLYNIIRSAFNETTSVSLFINSF